MRKLSSFICVFGIVTLLSCNKQEQGQAVSFDEALSDSEMVFDAVDSAVEVEATKATAATSITSFKAEATKGSAGSENSDAPYWNNVVFTSDGAGTPTYKASPAKYWPLTNPSYNIYAVAATSGSAAATAAAAPNLTFAAAGTTISMAAAYDKDVVCAYEPVADITYKTKNTLTFDHIFARLSTVKVTASGVYAISNITIKLVNAKTGGTYNLRTGHGQVNGTGWSSTVPADGNNPTIYTYAGSIASGSNNTGSNNDLYVVPGNYYINATWTASNDDYTQTFTTNSSSTILLEGGKINAIEANLTGNATEITFSVVLTAWGNKTISNVNFPTS